MRVRHVRVRVREARRAEPSPVVAACAYGLAFGFLLGAAFAVVVRG